MVDLATGLRLVGGVVLLFANGFFVTTEFAMTRIRQFDAEEFETPALERAWEMTERLEIYLSGCQVGITVSSVGLGVVAEPAVTATIDALAVAVGIGSPADGGGHTTAAVLLSLGIINILHVIIGEQVPTYLGVERTKFVARYGATPLYLWTKLMWPVIAVADWTSKWLLGLFGVEMTRSWTEAELEEGEVPSERGEVRRQMGEALASAGLSRERQEEVINALTIGERVVAEVMTDVEDVVALSTADDLATNLERVRQHPHSRYPLVGAEMSDVRGIVYTPAVFRERDRLERGELTIDEVAAPPMTMGPDTLISEAIDRFQAESQELAVVIEDDEALGVVATTDCFEAIIGDLEDPIDASELIEG